MRASICQGRAVISPVEDARFPALGKIAGCEHETKRGRATEQTLLFRKGPWFFKARYTFFPGPLSEQYRKSMAATQKAFLPCKEGGMAAICEATDDAPGM